MHYEQHRDAFTSSLSLYRLIVIAWESISGISNNTVRKRDLNSSKDLSGFWLPLPDFIFPSFPDILRNSRTSSSGLSQNPTAILKYGSTSLPLL